MPSTDVAEFVREVIADLDDLPEGFEQRLVGLVSSASSTRWRKIRELVEEVTRG